ncbi:MAG TPA: hypothetical protein PLS99_03635, partial [Thermotogota bacterium]|nr:hypothetical protein [Thermotogota bacterium]
RCFFLFFPFFSKTGRKSGRERLGTPTFKLACLKRKTGFAHREHREDKHRGVSAPSSRDGAIRFCTSLEKQGSHRGHGEHREKIFVNALGTPNFSLASFCLFTGSVRKRCIAA